MTPHARDHRPRAANISRDEQVRTKSDRLVSPMRERMREYNFLREQRLWTKRKRRLSKAEGPERETQVGDNPGVGRHDGTNQEGQNVAQVLSTDSNTTSPRQWSCDWCHLNGPGRYNGPHGPATLCSECGAAFQASWKRAQNVRKIGGKA
eukprot:SAG31_NODE_16622_length_702_cov_1.184080_2_plen_149_part_01